MGRAMQPIRDINVINDIERTLSEHLDTRQGRRAYLLWEIGVRMGMRISDMLQLKVGNLRRQEYYSYTPIKQRNKRGARPVSLPVSNGVQAALDLALEPGAKDDDPIFQSIEKTRGGNPKPITRMTAYRDMKWIEKVCGLTEPLGCHTMRKTFGYQSYRTDGKIAVLQKWFCHSSPATTEIYIGVDQDDFKRMANKMPFTSAAEMRKMARKKYDT